MSKNIYLVLQYDYRLVYLPFKSLRDVDDYTVGFDNLLDLVATTGRILELGIPNSEILDAYLSADIDKITDDMQEFSKRYLKIKYQADDYFKLDLEKKFIEYFNSNLHNHVFDEFKGLKNVYNSYISKYTSNRQILDKDMMKIALLYLGDDYKRYKECYYILKDKKIKMKIKEKHIVYNEENIKKMYEEDKTLLMLGTGMSIIELEEYISKQSKGKMR